MEDSQGLARRAACDRCRAQKLRCVRLSHSNAAKCKRCESAGATCHYSISKPAGRPSGNGHSSNAASSSNSSLVAVDAASGQRPNDNEREPKLSRSGSRLEQRPSDTSMGNEELDVQDPLESAAIDQNANNPATFAPDDMAWSPTARPTTAKTNGWQANQQTIMIPPIFNEPDLTLSGFSREDCSWWAYDSTMGGTPSSPTSWESLGQAGSTHSFPWSTMPWDSVNRDIGQTGIAPNCHSMGTESTIPAPTSTELLGAKDDCYTQSRAPMKMPPNSLLVDSEQTNTVVDQHRVSSDREIATGPHRWMQQFSELNLRLYQLASANSSLERDMSCGGKLAQFPTQLAGQVVDISSAFLDLLRAVGSRTQEDDGTAGTDQVSSQEEQIRLRNHRHHSFADDFSSESSGDEHSDVEPRSRGHKNRHFQRYPEGSGGLGKLGKNMSPLTDITTLLQLLACYLRLRDLHRILYTAIHHYMVSNTSAKSKTSSSQHDLSTTEQLSAKQRPLFKGLQIGGTSLEDFHPFQVKFVLQITVHILGEIEHTLGLPGVDRVSKKTDDEQPGILGAGVSPQLLKTVMRDNAVPGGRGGPDGSIVLAMRDRLSQLRKLLRGSINL